MKTNAQRINWNIPSYVESVAGEIPNEVKTILQNPEQKELLEENVRLAYAQKRGRQIRNDPRTVRLVLRAAPHSTTGRHLLRQRGRAHLAQDAAPPVRAATVGLHARMGRWQSLQLCRPGTLGRFRHSREGPRKSKPMNEDFCHLRASQREWVRNRSGTRVLHQTSDCS